MRIILFFSFLMLFSHFLKSQSETPRSKFSAGIDLIPGIVGLSGFDTDEVDLELIVRRNFERGAFRFRGSTTGFNLGSEPFSSIEVDTMLIESYYLPRNRFGIYLGGEYNITKSKHPFYIGLDIGYLRESGDVTSRPIGFNPFLSDEITEAHHHTFVLQAFIGIQIIIHRRWFINIESGPRIDIIRGDRLFYNENQELEKLNLDGELFDFGTLLRDISINFRF